MNKNFMYDHSVFYRALLHQNGFTWIASYEHDDQGLDEFINDTGVYYYAWS